MVIEYQQLKLQLITGNDIEQLRVWRNAAHVREHMEYQKEISTDEQINWYESLPVTQNLYFKVSTNNSAIGVVHLKNIDWKNATAEAGVFIGEIDYLNTATPIMAVIIMMRFAFDVLQLKQLKAKISTQNIKAIQFNQELGYTLQQASGNYFNIFTCVPALFYKKESKLAKVIQLLDAEKCLQLSITNNSSWITPYLNTSAANFKFYLP